MSENERGKVYTLKQWITNGGNISDIENKPNFDASGSVVGMRKLYYGYSCDLVKYNGYYYKVN